MPDWKGAGPSKIRGFWLISFTAIHEVLAIALNECVEVEGVSGWLVEGRTISVMEDPKKDTNLITIEHMNIWGKWAISRRAERE